MNTNSEYTTIKNGDLEISQYTSNDYSWGQSLGSDSSIRVFKNLTIDGDLDLDQYAHEAGYAGIVVTGDLKVSGRIENLDGDTGLSLCVAGVTSARSLFGGGSIIILNAAKIENLTVGHYNHGKLLIEKLETKALMNFAHHTEVTNTNNVRISVDPDMILGALARIDLGDLLEYWYKNNIFKEYILYEEDKNEDGDEELDDSYYYISEDDLFRDLTPEKELTIIGELENYIKEGSRQVDIDLPKVDKNSIQYRWVSGLLVGVTICNLKGMELFSKAIGPDKSPSLRSLKLKGFKTDEIPDTFKHLSQLQKFTVNRCRLRVIPEWIGGLTKLKILDLSINRISELPDSLQHLTELVELEISQNKLTGLPDCLGKLNKLKIISLDNNKISIVSDAIQNLKLITKLDLSWNKLTSIPNGICEMSQLRELDFSNNTLVQISESIGNLKKLTLLDCKHNNLTEVPSGIGYLKNLSELNFGYNSLSMLPGSMAKLKKLKELKLYNNQLSEMPECIKGLDKLFKLYLDFNNIVEFPEWFVMIMSIGILGIKGNKFVTLPEVITRRYLLRDEETYNREEMEKINFNNAF